MRGVKLAARTFVLLLSFLCIVCVSDDGGRGGNPENRLRHLEEKMARLEKYVLPDQDFCSLPSPVRACRKLRWQIESLRYRHRRDVSRLREKLREEARVRKCPTGFRYYHHHCYLFSNVRKNWSEANHTCREMGAQLLRIRTHAEFNFTKKYIRTMKPPPTRVWVGLGLGKFDNQSGQLMPVDLNKFLPISATHTWHWVDNPKPFDAANNEAAKFLCPSSSCLQSPPDGTAYFCAAMDRQSGWTLKSEQCKATHAYVCEIDQRDP